MTTSELFTNALESISIISNNYFYLGRLDDAVSIAEQGAILARYDDVPQIEKFEALLNYASILSQQAWLQSGDYPALDAIIKELEDLVLNDSQKGQLLNLKGNILRQQALNATERDFATPRKMFEESVSLLDEIRMPKAYFWSLFRMGICDQFEGTYDSALEIFQRAEVIAREHDFKHELSYATRHIGFVHQLRENYDDALPALQESLALRLEIDFRIFLAMSYVAVANILHLLKRDDEAIGHYQEAIASADEIGFSRPQMIIRANYGQALFDNGDSEKAQSYLLDAQKFADELEHAGVQKMTAGLLSQIAEQT